VQFPTDRTNIKQRHAVGRFHQEVEVASVGVLTMKDGAENPRVAAAMRGDHSEDSFTVLVEKS
jgi:hypothetical protein